MDYRKTSEKMYILITAGVLALSIECQDLGTDLHIVTILLSSVKFEARENPYVLKCKN